MMDPICTSRNQAFTISRRCGEWGTLRNTMFQWYICIARRQSKIQNWYTVHNESSENMRPVHNLIHRHPLPTAERERHFRDQRVTSLVALQKAAFRQDNHSALAARKHHVCSTWIRQKPGAFGTYDRNDDVVCLIA